MARAAGQSPPSRMKSPAREPGGRAPGAGECAPAGARYAGL